jgi:hypothetical protein
MDDKEEEEQREFHGPHQENESENNVRNLPALVPESLTNPYFNKDKKNKKKHKSFLQSRLGGDDDDFNFEDFDWSKYYGGGYGSSYKAKTEKDFTSYEFLKEYSQVFNLFTASSPSLSPYSNKAIYIIDVLSKLGVKFRVDIFPYGSGYSFGSAATDTTSHRLINIIAEPNPEVQGPAIVFSAHHDVANPRSENCQDNGASVCNLLRLAALISAEPTASQRTLLVFTDCEESGAKGARRFADGLVSKNSKTNPESEFAEHKIYGDIFGVIILELTGHGTHIWTDCPGHNNNYDIKLHKHLEAAACRRLPKYSTPPSDVYAFRGKLPALCIGTLKEDDAQSKSVWRICHSMTDTIEKCSEEEMTEFVNFLHSVSKLTIDVVPTQDVTQADDPQLKLDLDLE